MDEKMWIRVDRFTTVSRGFVGEGFRARIVIAELAAGALRMRAAAGEGAKMKLHSGDRD